MKPKLWNSISFLSLRSVAHEQQLQKCDTSSLKEGLSSDEEECGVHFGGQDMSFRDILDPPFPFRSCSIGSIQHPAERRKLIMHLSCTMRQNGAGDGPPWGQSACVVFNILRSDWCGRFGQVQLKG